MITAIDTSVLLDVLGGDPTHGRGSMERLRGASREGRLVACDVVFAEVGGQFPSLDAARVTLDRLRLELDALQAPAALLAGTTWRRYRQEGGPRTRVIADFLIGAHAFRQADRLLTRDRGFYRRYFSDLAILDPLAS